LFVKKTGRRRSEGARTGRGIWFQFELLEDRITPTTVTGLSPTSGPAVGGTSVMISGSGFTGATIVDFGTKAAMTFNVVNDTSITADSPAGTGVVDVTVTAPGGTSPTSPADEFTYGPTVSGISPMSGPLGGGTLVTITGTSFTGATAVDFGATLATNITVVSATSITADSPAGTGTVDVTVTTPAGKSPTSPADQFTYAAAPTVTGISPTNGPAAGGTPVMITGTDFTGATAVQFGTAPALSFMVVSATSITADSPAGTGTVDVTVTTPSGQSATSSADQFTYVPAPTVIAVSPGFGPAAGGSVVTITGSNFAGATAVDFGKNAAPNFTVVSNTSIAALSPPGTGVVDVVVTSPGGKSATSTSDLFTYAPTVTGVSPTSGSAGGGTSVKITGTGFSGATAVDFGTVPATNFTVSSATSITATSPAGIGLVNVTVTGPAGTSAVSAADEFSYGPTIFGISPSAGPKGGGTLVSIAGLGFTGATAVDFGTVPATSFTFVSDTSITAISPAGTGVVNVTVTTPAGTSPASSADQFTYTAAPTVTRVSTRSGSQLGGDAVTITGTNLAGVTAIHFGTTAAKTLLSDTGTQIVVVSPEAPIAGAVNVTVTTAGGTSAISPNDLFFYSNPLFIVPRISAITPAFGPPSGGTLVTITGVGFDQTSPAAVYFGLNMATNVQVVNTTTLTAVSPAGALGTVQVTAITLGGQSNVVAGNFFSYSTDGPRVTSVLRYGFHTQPTYLLLNFNSSLEAATAQNVSNYQIVGPGGQKIRVNRAVYDSASNNVTLVLASRLNLLTTYRLTVNGTAPSGVRSSGGVLLDGAGTGVPGTNFVASITSRNLAGADSRLPTLALVRPSAVRRAQLRVSTQPLESASHKAAVDRLLISDSLSLPRRRALHSAW
jgi:hypothetical protein